MASDECEIRDRSFETRNEPENQGINFLRIRTGDNTEYECIFGDV